MNYIKIASEEFVKENYSEVRRARNIALINMALMDAGIVCWDAKYFYFNPRPSQINPAIKTLTGVPNFPSYTSGHYTFSAAAATVLTHILPDREANYEYGYGSILVAVVWRYSLPERLPGGIGQRCQSW